MKEFRLIHEQDRYREIAYVLEKGEDGVDAIVVGKWRTIVSEFNREGIDLKKVYIYLPKRIPRNLYREVYSIAQKVAKEMGTEVIVTEIAPRKPRYYGLDETLNFYYFEDKVELYSPDKGHKYQMIHILREGGKKEIVG